MPLDPYRQISQQPLIDSKSKFFFTCLFRKLMYCVLGQAELKKKKRLIITTLSLLYILANQRY